MMMGLFGMSGKSSRSESNRSALDPESVDPPNDVPKAASPTAVSSVSKDTGEKSFDTPLTQDTMSDASDHSLDHHDHHAAEAGEPAVVDTNSPPPSDEDFSDQQKVSQMKKLAESLGLPPSFFGITEDGTSDLSGWNPNQGPPQSAFPEKHDRDVSNQDSSEDKEQDEVESISVDVGAEEKGEGQVAKRWHESDDTMLSNTDDDHYLEDHEHRQSPAHGEWQSTPVRREFKPHPTTLAEKRQAKEDAVSRLNRIKAKAVKSVTKSLGVDENNLSYAVGLSTDAHLTKTARKKMTDAPNMDDPDHVQFIADALGLPIEMFGVTHLAQKSTDTLATQWPVSLAHELGINVEDSAISSNAFENLESGIPVRPQAGSLAAALGMAVDDSEGAPPVRHVTFESKHVGPKDPNPGLLPADLHMPADSAANQSVPPTTSASSGDHAPAVPQIEQPREGSLAQALGMAVSSSTLSKSRQSDEEEAESPVRALGIGVGSSASATSTISRQSGQAQPGSLAFALGISVDYSENAPPIQSVKSTQVLIAPLLEPARVGLSEKSPTHGTTSRAGTRQTASPRQILRPQVGSIPSALEMKVDRSIKTPLDEHDQSISSTDSDSSAEDSHSDGLSGQPKPGSLAAALGMQVDPGYNPVQWQKVSQDQTLLGAVFCNVFANVSKLSSPNLKSLGSSSNLKSLGSHKEAQPQKGSLADALGMRITDEHEKTLAQESKAGCGIPRASSSGSLVATLGMTIDDEFPMNAKDLPIAPVAGSLAAALGITGIGQNEKPVVKEGSRVFSAPLPGSLAAALGIAIKDDLQMPAPSKSEKATQLNAPRPGSLAAALGMAIGDDHELRAPPKYVRPKTGMPGSLAAAQDMVSSDDRIIPVNSISAHPKSARSGARLNAPLPGSLAAALGLAISDNHDVQTPLKSARSDARPSAPLPGSLAAALGMATSDKHEILPYPKSNARAGTLHAAAPGSLAAALGLPVCKDSEIAVEQNTSQVRCFAQPVAGSLAAALGMFVSDDKQPPIPAKEQAHTRQAKVAVAGSLAAALGVAVSEDPELPSQTKSCAHPGRFVRPVAGSFAAAVGHFVNDEKEMSGIQKSQVRAVQHRDPAAGSLAAALGMVVSEQESFVSLQTSRFRSESAQAAPVAGSLAAALGMKVKDDHAPLGSQTSQARSVQHRAAVPGSLAAALGIAVSDEELSVSVTNSPLRFEPHSEAPVSGSLAAALGMAVNCAYQIPIIEKSDVHLVGNLSNASRVTKPQARSLADALGMSVDTSNVAPPVREIKTSLGGIEMPSTSSSDGFAPTDGWQGPRMGHYFGTGPKGTGYYTDLYTSSPEPLPSTIIRRQVISQEASVEMAASEQRGAARSPPVLVAPNSDAEIRLVVELAAARAETAAAKAYGKAMEQQMSQMSKSYSMKLAELQRQIESYEAELEEKSRALEAAVDQQQRSLGRSGDDEEMRDTQEGLIQRLCQSAERMTRTRHLLEEADSMLQTEINEIRTVKSGYDEQYHEDESVSSGSSGSSGSSAESQSRASRDLQVKLAREDDRRKTIKARLQAMREAQA